MRLALISVSTEHEAGHGPVGMLPLFDGNIVEKQVRSAQNMGASKIILLSPTMHGALLQYVDGLKRHGIDAEIIRSAGDLNQYAALEDDLIFLGDGVFPGEAIENHISNQSDERIYVVANADIYADFERIDLSHRWLGIALLKATRLEEISQIPDDWDIGSALLRTAVQSECHRELVSDEDMQADAVPQLLSRDASMTFASRQLGNIRIPKQNFLDRYAVWPLMRKLIPVLWKAPDAKKYVGMASIACAVMAIGLGSILWPAVSLGFLFLGSLALILHDRISIFSAGDGPSDWVGPSFHLLATAALTITVVKNAASPMIFAELTILLLLIGNFWLVRAGPNNVRLNGIRPDIPLILLALSVASAFGFLSIGVGVAALFCVMYLIATSSDRFATESSRNPQN